MLKIIDDKPLPDERPPAPVVTLPLDNGETVEINDGPCGQAVRIRAADGAVILDYDSRTGKAVVKVPTGDLSLVSESGDIELAAARDIRFKAERTVAVQGKSGVQIGSGDAGAALHPAIRLGRKFLRLDTPELTVLGRRGNIRLDELDFAGKRLNSALEEARMVVDRLDVVADRVRHRARNVYQTVTGLWHTRAVRGRALFSGSYFHKSRSLSLRAEKEAKVDGEQILLG